ncbi:ABC transporter substrate-binding protein [Planosporangium mesophilum]|uniref:ABC transporter substrate-binding protein n=1 Tax=Planosporangium mesophilum TaxID=689768 RepID=UPI00143B1EF7|nr:ABC transporter substrate-binding protein [Planosporangium mesophilum]NJC82948.1 ABC transporter substrate-binding protein [Planosporangium mesophilum]
MLQIGTLGPLTGPAADFGLSMEGSTKFVAEEANKAGGVKVGNKTCQVKVVSYDTGYTSAGAANGANDFASKGVKFVIGPLGATEVTGMKPVADRSKMLLLANGFGLDALEKKYPLVFHIGPGPFVWSGPIIKEARTRFGFTSAAVIAPNDQSGNDIAVINEKKFSEQGIPVKRDTYQRGTQDFAPIVSRLMATRADVIDFASSPAGDVGTMIKQLRQAGYQGSFARLGGESTNEITRVAGIEAMKNFFYYSPVDLTDPKIAALAKEYEAVAGIKATGISLGWVPGGRALLRAISKAGTIDDTAKVAEALRADDLKDTTLGQGVWTGQQQFGVNQEMSWPFSIGVIKDAQPSVFKTLSAE